MIPDKTTNVTLPTPNYMPYFYQAGLYLWSPRPGLKAPTPAPQQVRVGYDFTSDLVGATPTQSFQSVEQIIQNGYFAIPKTEPETALITDKQHTSWQGLDEVVREVQGRRQLSQQIIYDLEQAKCAAVSNLYEQVAYQGHPPMSLQIYSLNKRLGDLYSEQRQERLDLWRDVVKIRQLIPEQAESYLNAYRKVALLNDSSDSP